MARRGGFFIVLFAFLTPILIVINLQQTKLITFVKEEMHLHPLPHKNKLQAIKEKLPKVELTIRMPTDVTNVGRLLCMLIRSASIYWDPEYGPVHLILDEKDNETDIIERFNRDFGYLFTFKASYEQNPVYVKRFQQAAIAADKTIGKIINKSLCIVLLICILFLPRFYFTLFILIKTFGKSRHCAHCGGRFVTLQAPYVCSVHNPQISMKKRPSCPVLSTCKSRHHYMLSVESRIFAVR